MTVDLSTTYLAMRLKNPLVASASPLTGKLDSLRQLEEAGVAAVVLPSLFEEQIEHESMAVHESIEFGADGFAEAAAGYFPEMDDYNTGPGDYLDLIAEAKSALDIPVIASLNGVSRGGWVRYATLMQEAGADAIELNVYFVAADPGTTPEQVEARYVDLVTSVSEAISIPLAVKIGPYFSAVGHLARRLAQAGASSLVLFNRFYQPDIDLETLEVAPNLILSTEAEMRLVLRWVAILHGRVDANLAATTGVHSSEAVVKLVLAGADVAMMTSALLARGPRFAGDVLAGLTDWFDSRGYVSLDQARGSLSQINAPDPEAFERANYMKTLVSWSMPAW